MTMMSVITAEAPEALLARMEQDLASAPLPPFEDECIVVQSLGMDRWVRQQFARRQGCAASMDMPFPAAFCRQLASTLQRDRRFATGDGISIDPRFEEQALVWRLFTLLRDDAFLAHPHYEPLRAFLHNAGDAKRFGLARRIAARFDEYRLYRPELLITWEEHGAARGASVHETWQASLWQTLLGNARPAHFARWFVSTITQLETVTDAPAGLPSRVSVFGVSTLPPLFVRLLRAVARFVPVRCYVLMPQADGWQPTAARHPLFESFGASSRELVGQLLDATPAPSVEHIPAARPPAPATLLPQLQQGVATGRVTPFTVAPHDRSITVHVCHSPLRELEVLRDQLLDAFAHDPTLRPHDVLVMAPDVEQYAPMAEAIFGQSRLRGTGTVDDERPTIPYRIADRTLSRESAPAAALASLLQLVPSRLGASEVLELLSQPMVRRAAGIAPGQLDQITQWVEDAAIRWGHDAATRASWQGAPAFAENSWRTGLDRLLAGYATGRVDALVNGVRPLSGDLVGDTALLGAFVQWVETLMTWVATLRGEYLLPQWTTSLLQALEWLVRAEDADERASIDRVRRDLERLAAPTGAETGDQPVSFDVVRDWVLEALADDEHASGFLTGGLTLCAMKPMRAIPHRIIVMLGLDDRAYPRRLRRAAFDLIGAHPLPGDRDPRADDRQLMLDTLMSAGDRLLLSYVGRSQANNREIAPSIVITELLDTIDRLYPAEQLPSAQLRVEHPLQPFSPAYFTNATTRDPRLFSYDARLARSVAGSVHRATPLPFFDGTVPEIPLWRDLRPGRSVPATPPLEISIDDIMEAWLNPSRVYCRRVLQLTVAAEETQVSDVEPMEVDARLRTIVQDRMLQHALEGRHDAGRERALEVAAGRLPVAALGASWYDALRQHAAPMLARLEGVTFDDPLAVEVEGLDWVVRGHLALQRPGEQWRVRAATLKTRDKVRAWVAHVVRCAAGGPVTTRVIARDSGLDIPPIADAQAQLDVLVQGVRAAWSTPLPYFLDAAVVYRKKAIKGDASAIEAACHEYHRQKDDYRQGGDNCDPYVQRLWRGRDPVREYAAQFAALADAFWARFDEVTAS